MKKNIAIISFLILLTGCGAITINNSELEEHTFPKIAPKGSLYVVSLGIDQTLNGEPSSVISEESIGKAEYWIGLGLFGRWEDKDLISKYTTSNINSDYTIEMVGVRDKYTPIPLSVISGLTVGLIPTWVTETYTLDIYFTNNHTGKEYQVQVENSATTIVHIALAPFILLSGLGINDMYNDTSAYIYHELDSQGAFQY